MKDWNGKVVWIVGASSGIGKAFAECLYRRGAAVIGSCPRGEPMREVWNGLDADPDRHHTLYLDMSDTASLQNAAEQAAGHFGRVDMLINNAGVSQRALLAEMKPEIIEKLLKINLLGHILITRYVLPGMIERKSGIILGTSSITGKFGSPLRTVYSAAKHGLIGFYDSLRAEVWKDNIQVTVGIPGFVRTDISRHALTGSGQAQNKMDNNQAKGISPEECAENIIRGVERGKWWIYTGLDIRARLALYLQGRVPGLLGKIIRNADVT
jgi:dehydrogenase/reductase SDR family member 7B